MGLTSETRFKHESLDHNDSVRLLELNYGLPIRATLRQYRLSKPPKYVALSYTWGEAENSKDIEVNGLKFPVRPNLHSLLEQLCQQSKRRTLWCDAICIDQDTVRERNHQVTMMGQIYQTAHRVLVWLGEELEDSDFIFKVLASPPLATKLGVGEILDHDSARQFGALREVCQRPYWKRTWILQEVLLARDVKVLCGNRRTSWKTFASCCIKAATSRVQDTGQSSWMTRCKQDVAKSFPTQLSSQRRARQTRRLEELLTTYGDSECSDFRDRIYGLLGLATDGDSVGVDYSLSLDALFFKLVVFSPYIPDTVLERVLVKWTDEQLIVHPKLPDRPQASDDEPEFRSMKELERGVTVRIIREQQPLLPAASREIFGRERLYFPQLRYLAWHVSFCDRCRLYQGRWKYRLLCYSRRFDSRDIGLCRNGDSLIRALGSLTVSYAVFIGSFAESGDSAVAIMRLLSEDPKRDLATSPDSVDLNSAREIWKETFTKLINLGFEY